MPLRRGGGSNPPPKENIGELFKSIYFVNNNIFASFDYEDEPQYGPTNARNVDFPICARNSLTKIRHKFLFWGVQEQRLQIRAGSLRIDTSIKNNLNIKITQKINNTTTILFTAAEQPATRVMDELKNKMLVAVGQAAARAKPEQFNQFELLKKACDAFFDMIAPPHRGGGRSRKPASCKKVAKRPSSSSCRCR